MSCLVLILCQVVIMNFTCNSPHSSSGQVLASFYRWGKGGNAIFYQLPTVPGFVSGRAKIPNLCVILWHGDPADLCTGARQELSRRFLTDQSAHLLLTWLTPTFMHLQCPHVPSPKLSSTTVSTRPPMICPTLKDWVLLTIAIPVPVPYSIIFLHYSESVGSCACFIFLKKYLFIWEKKYFSALYFFFYLLRS